MRIHPVFLLVGALVIGALAYCSVSLGTRKPAHVVKAADATTSPANTNGSMASPLPQPYRKEFEGGSSLVWTAGVGGVAYISNTSPQVPLFKFLGSQTWKATAVPLRFQYVHAAQPELESHRVAYQWSADTFDFRRPLPAIEFKDYER